MEQAPKTRLQPFRPSADSKLEDIAYNAGMVKGEENIIGFLMGFENE